MIHSTDTDQSGLEGLNTAASMEWCYLQSWHRSIPIEHSYTTCSSHHFPVYTCNWNWELSASTSPMPKFCVPWAAQKLGAQHFWLILTTFLAIILLPFCNKDFIPMPPQSACENRACHQSFSLQKWLYASMASSAVTERSNDNTLFSHHFVSHINSKLIWEGRFASLTFNSTLKFVVAVENHCTCYSFLSFMICTHFPLHHAHCTIFQSIWVVSGLSSTFWSMTNKMKSFHNSGGNIKSNNWKAVNFKWIGNNENIGLLFDPFNCLLSQIPDSLWNKLFETSSLWQKPFQILGNYQLQYQQIQLEWQHC